MNIHLQSAICQIGQLEAMRDDKNMTLAIRICETAHAKIAVKYKVLSASVCLNIIVDNAMPLSTMGKDGMGLNLNIHVWKYTINSRDFVGVFLTSSVACVAKGLIVNLYDPKS